MAKEPKVFCIGMMKTGTTTLHEALTMLGYRVSDRSWRLFRPMLFGRWAIIENHIQQWDAFEDTPIPLMYKELDARFPGSKFILTIRDSESWYKSVSHHVGNLRRPVNEYTFGRGKGLPRQDREHTIRIYEAHNAAVQTHFKNRPEQLLVIGADQRMDWDSIAAFLNVTPPDAPFPHANATNYDEPGFSEGKQTLDLCKKRVKFSLLNFVFNAFGLIPKR